MTIVDLLEKNSRELGDEIALVEINPEISDNRRLTWRDYELVQPTERSYYRTEISWTVFNEKANRFANALMGLGIGKGVHILTVAAHEGAQRSARGYQTINIVNIDVG